MQYISYRKHGFITPLSSLYNFSYYLFSYFEFANSVSRHDKHSCNHDDPLHSLIPQNQTPLDVLTHIIYFVDVKVYLYCYFSLWIYLSLNIIFNWLVRAHVFFNTNKKVSLCHAVTQYTYQSKIVTKHFLHTFLSLFQGVISCNYRASLNWHAAIKLTQLIDFEPEAGAYHS